MPLGATVRAGKGSTVDFGVDDWDTFVDESLAKLRIEATGDPPGSVYLSAHSGGGFTISALGSEPFKKYRFGGVFGFESFHGDLDAWIKLAKRHLRKDLAQLKKLRKQAAPDEVAAQQLAYLRNGGFRVAAFGGFGGYGKRVRSLDAAIDEWLAGNDRALTAATGGNPAVLDQLSRNYRATYTGDRPLKPGENRHMAALSQESHFESALESTLGGAPPPVTAPADHKQKARDEHRGEQPPPTATKPPQPAKPAAKKRAKRAAPKWRSLQEPLQFSSYPLLKEPIVLVKGDDEHSKKHAAAKAKAEAKDKEAPKPGLKPDMSAIPAEFMVEILRRAKVPDPDHFFDKFVRGVTFLGRPINAPIHQRLAEHLRDVERELADQHGGPDKDPKVAGDALGLSDQPHAGARQASGTAAISMHMFGLAIDVNHYRNPYLQAKGGMPVAEFRSIAQLMQGKDGAIGLGASEEDAGVKFKRLQAHNQMVVDYFALADPAKEKELEDKLAKAAGPWKKRDVKQARKQIEADLASLGSTRRAGSDLEMLRKHGYLQLREEVVRGMKMNWAPGTAT